MALPYAVGGTFKIWASALELRLENSKKVVKKPLQPEGYFELRPSVRQFETITTKPADCSYVSQICWPNIVIQSTLTLADNFRHPKIVR